MTIEEKIEHIERGIGNVAWAAYTMCEDGFASKKWAKEHIERGIGDVALAAHRMYIEGFASKKWAKEQGAYKDEC